MYIDPIIVKFLNNYERNRFNNPVFQLVWSEECYEYRWGTFRENDLSGNFLREKKGLHKVRKYNYVTERWILEKWLPPEKCFNLEVPETSGGSYEPVFVFEDKNGNYLSPNLKVIEYLTYAANGNQRVMNATERETLAEKLKDKEIQEFMDMLDNETPLQTALKTGEAVGYGS